MSTVDSDVVFDKDPDAVINEFQGDLATFLEAEIKAQYEVLQFYKKITALDEFDVAAAQQVDMHMAALQELIKRLLELRRDSAFVAKSTKPIIDDIGESTCKTCGKLEQVTLTGPFDRPQQKKKKRKMLAHVPLGFRNGERVEFRFTEDYREWKDSGLFEAKLLTFDHPSSFVGRVVYEKADKSMQIVLGDAIYNFCSMPREIYDGFRRAASKGKFFNQSIKGAWDC